MTLASRAQALFSSSLQPSQQPTSTQIRAAIRTSVYRPALERIAVYVEDRTSFVHAPAP